jgi:hypothetical protein
LRILKGGDVGLLPPVGLNKFGTGLTHQHCNRVGRRHQFVQHLKALSGQLGTDGGEAGEIARRTIEARYQARLDGVASYSETDRDSLRRRLGDLALLFTFRHVKPPQERSKCRRVQWRCS